MFRKLHCRPGHYALLALVWGVLCLPYLGSPSLWDIDEGNNAEAAREMWQSGNWIVPTCNYHLRDDKPALLYWLQAFAYGVFGVNEFAARLPSALAALVALLAAYELGRSMFGAAVGLLGGVLLGSALLFCASAHFANPDALLNAFSTLSLLFFWRDFQAGRRGWSPWSAAFAGLAVLAKGPVGLALPAAVGFLFLLCRLDLRRLLSPRLPTGLLVFLLVAAPWYVWVAVETKGVWVAGFWNKHNADRFTGTMEGHGGPFYYYLLVLLAGCAPWSVFFGPTAWFTLKQAWRRKPAEAEENPERPDARPALQFLQCWIVVYLLFFSVSSTKLPNYVLPLYPAAAVLTANFLDRWRRGLVQTPSWTLYACLACMALVGVGMALGALTAGGVIAVPRLQGKELPGLESYAVLGAIPILGAAAAAWCLFRGRRAGAIVTAATASVLFTAATAGLVPDAVDHWKTPRPLVAALPSDQTRRDVRVAGYAYFEPSLVFYARREVVLFKSDEEALEFLHGPLPSYLFLPARRWDDLAEKMQGTCHVLARRRDLYDNAEIVVVGNSEAEASARQFGASPR